VTKHVGRLQKSLRPFLIALPALGLILGLAARLMGGAEWSEGIWITVTVPVLVALLAEIATSIRRGAIGLDIIAALSMFAALVFGEYLAAAIVALMYAGGQYLEDFAERRANREMTALLARVPRTAMRHSNGNLEEVELDSIGPGDRLLIRQGDVVPVDGVVANGVAVLDQSALTGESMPSHYRARDTLMSGAANVGAAFDMLATRRARESTYAGIVRLVTAAQRARAPMSRLADQYSMAFLAVTVLLAGAAWLWSGDPIRAVAVLVVATPCPLILGVPIAMVAGLSRAARQGILIKGGKALESLARVQAIVIDKTGTLTHGQARLISTRTFNGATPDEVLRLAASLDQASRHVIAATIVEAARDRGLALSVPSQVNETAGEGVEGYVDGRRVVVGGPGFVARHAPRSVSPTTASIPGAITVSIAVDDQMAGVLVLADELRAGIEPLLQNLRQLGVGRIVLATGDRREVADQVARGLSIDVVRSELTPEQKTLVVLSERKYGCVMMIGDGVNDAPALAAADVGVAMGAQGAAASAEAADVVLLVDQLDRVLPAMKIARRSRQIALQSVFIGIGLSVAGMVAAALGHLPPVQGALFQEIIDVAAVLNALRALTAPTK
jgi:heavy metal translocating P-type ATPase